jgi:hypothetical protein
VRSSGRISDRMYICTLYTVQYGDVGRLVSCHFVDVSQTEVAVDEP